MVLNRELDTTLIDRLRALLGSKPRDEAPWGALLPQLLLWCFRRFCVEKLMILGDALLLDQVWEDYFELVQNYAPKGLQMIGKIWLTPDHLDQMVSTPDEYNELFLDILEMIDLALAEEDDLAQDQLSKFLDEDIRRTVLEWIPEDNPFCIYPTKSEDEDHFPDKKFIQLIKTIVHISEKNIPEVPQVEEQPEVLQQVEEQPEVLQQVEEQPEVLQQVEEQPEVLQKVEEQPEVLQQVEEQPEVLQKVEEQPEVLQQVEEQQVEEQQPEDIQQPEISPPAALKQTVKQAFTKHRKTYRRHGRRSNRGYTIKVHRPHRKSRKA